MPRNGQPQPLEKEYIYSKPRARQTDIVIREVADEVLVYDLKRHKAHCLNQTAAIILQYCNGDFTIAEIARQIGREHKLPVDEATVWLAVSQLNKSELLEDYEIPLMFNSRTTRRELLQKLGQGVALTMPLVTTILAPAAAMAASCIATGSRGTCTSVGGNNCCSTCCNNTTDICLQTGLGNGAICERDCQCTNSTQQLCPSVPVGNPRICI